MATLGAQRVLHRVVAPSDPSLRIARLLACGAIALGVAILLGWAFDIDILRGSLAGLVAAQPSAAVFLVAMGGAVVAQTSGTRAGRWFALLLAVIALVIALSMVCHALFGFGLGIERVLFIDAVERVQPTSEWRSGRLSVASSAILAIIALALLLSCAQGRIAGQIFVVLATLGLLTSASVTTGFLYDLRAIHNSALYNLITLPLAVGAALVSFAVLCLRPDLGWMRLLSGEESAAREMRSLALGVTALSAALALLLQLGLRSGWYAAEFRTALLVSGVIVIVFLALLMTASRLRLIDEGRQRSAQARERLETELAIALAAAKMVVLHYDLKQQVVRRLAAGDSAVRLSRVAPYDEHLKLVHEDDREQVAGYLVQRTRAKETSYQIQYRLGQGERDVKWVLEKGEIRYGDDGGAEEIAGVMLDVTPLVEAREAARESEERFKRLAETMPQIVYIAGPAGDVQYANNRWFDYTGVAAEARDKIEDIIPPEDLARARSAFESATTAREPYETELRLRGIDGQYRWFLNRALPVLEPDGAIRHWYGTLTDIDAQKRAHEELRLVTDHADVLLAHCDGEGRFVFVNRSYAQRFGGEPNSFSGKTIPEVIGAEAYARIEPYIARALAGERVTFEAQMPYERIGERFVSCHYVPDIDATTGAVRGFVAAITDITERRALEERLREIDRRKDEFIALLAHELRNPLAPIRYSAGLLKPGVPPEISAAAQDVIERQVAHMARLLDDLLDVSRITHNSLELREELVDLREIVATAVDTVRPLFTAEKQELSLSLPPTSMYVQGDSTRLLQTLGNLLDNAAKFTPAGGHIAVETATEEGMYVVRVQDSGSGIAPELMPKLFDLFVQGERTHARPSGGLGIGLSLAKRLMEMHKGTLEAHSAGPGQGSTFVMRLPPAPAVQRIEPVAVPAPSPALQEKQQLLIVDDNVDAANGLALLAQLSGYVTYVANDGLAAIELAASVRPNAIVMDLGLPKMSGLEAARWIRQQKWGRELALIAVTGWGQEEDRRRSKEAGFDVHLTKPVDSDELLGHLQRLSVPHAPRTHTRARRA
jgi:PAS domain S-box-containing protein